MKKLLLSVTAILFANFLHAQFEINAIGTPETIDFTGFTGSGFQPGGGGGTLNSDDWSATGFSEGDVAFGATAISGDFARGSTMGLVTTGGIYGVDILGNQGLMVQPTADDFSPGSFILKILNNTGSDIGSIDLAYTIYVLNDQNRSSSFNFSFSYDNISYTNIPAIDYTTPEVGDFSPYMEAKSTSIPGLTIINGSEFYLRWTSDDVAGSGSRDEIAIDDISITGNPAVLSPIINFNTGAITIDETGGSADFILQSTETTDCTMHLSLSPSGTATEDADFTYDIPGTLIFLEGEASMAFLYVDILDDLIDEADETVIVQIDDVSGTCTLGLPSSVTITIQDDDATPPPVYSVFDIADVTTEDIDGVADSLNVKADLTGIVYGVNLWDGGLQFTLIDETGGISVFNFDNDFGYTVTEGDEVNIKGTIDQYNGLTEIVADTLIFISSGNEIILDAGVIELDESTESDLVEVSFGEPIVFVDPAQWLGDGTSFNFQIVHNVDDTITLRIDDNTELASIAYSELFYDNDSPQLHLIISGIGGQFDTDSPYLSGYQLFPRYLSDFYIIYESITQLNPSQISIYPNPTTTNLILSGKENIEWVEIINQLGETIQTISINNFETNIDVENIAAGFYFMKIKTDTGIYSSNFVKQ